MTSRGHSDYKVVRADENNIFWLSELLQANGSSYLSRKQLKKKYNTEYTGLTYIAHFAITLDGSPAAFFCLFPTYLWVENKKVLAAQSADIITHPNHQRKGLFGLLGKATEELALSVGIDYVFAFPNTNSFPGFIKSLGWQHIGNFHTIEGAINEFAWFRIFRKLRMLGIYDKWIQLRIKKYKISNDDERLYRIPSMEGQLRDGKFYNYKSWSGSYWLAYKGIAIWMRRDSDILLIGDIRFTEKSIWLESRNEILHELCKKMGLSMWRFDESTSVVEASNVNICNSKDSGVSVVYSNLRNRNQRLTLAFTGGDTDVF